MIAKIGPPAAELPQDGCESCVPPSATNKRSHGSVAQAVSSKPIDQNSDRHTLPGLFLQKPYKTPPRVIGPKNVAHQMHMVTGAFNGRLHFLVRLPAVYENAQPVPCHHGRRTQAAGYIGDLTGAIGQRGRNLPNLAQIGIHLQAFQPLLEGQMITPTLSGSKPDPGTTQQKEYGRANKGKKHNNKYPGQRGFRPTSIQKQPGYQDQGQYVPAHGGKNIHPR